MCARYLYRYWYQRAGDWSECAEVQNEDDRQLKLSRRTFLPGSDPPRAPYHGLENNPLPTV